MAGAVTLAFFFGPLGMLYATIPGAIVMFFVNLIVAIPTLGLGLLITFPIGMLWAGMAASSHNNALQGSSQFVQTAPAAAQVASNSPPAGWHHDPDGTGRLRFWNGAAWTEQYSDASPDTPNQPALTTESESATSQVFCGSCGAGISEENQFCPACGDKQLA